MNHIFWVKQTADKPLFEDLIWSRPGNKAQAGKLLIIGGNLHGFAAPAEAYSEATKAGVGLTRVLLPQAVKRLAGNILETVEYAPSTPSGSFSQEALAAFLEHASWADAVLLAGDFGRNSETAVLLEKFASKYGGQIVMTKDVVDYFSNIPREIFERGNITLVVSLAQLQKLAKNLRFTMPITFSMDLLKLTDTLHELTEAYPTGIITSHLDTIFVSVNGQVSTTPAVSLSEATTGQAKPSEGSPAWRIKTASRAAVWWLQNPNKPFEALTTSIVAR